MRPPELFIHTAPTPDEIQYLEDRIYEFNATATGRLLRKRPDASPSSLAVFDA